MAISQIIWSLDDKEQLQPAELINEKELEDILAEHIEILDADWLLIGRQVRTVAGKFIDLLCMDHDGDLIVVELKKDLTPREVTAQAIDYASCMADLTLDQLAELYLQFSGGTWYSNTLKLLSPGDRIWVNIPHTGYVGVGIVKSETKQAKDALFTVDGKHVGFSELQMQGEYLHSLDEPENAEYVVQVDWIKTVPESQAVKEVGFFGNQNSVCRPRDQKWVYTVERLKKVWAIEP